MAFISEIHYKDSVARATGVQEYVEVSLTAAELPNAANFTISVYERTGALNDEVNLSTLTPVLDTVSGLYVFTFVTVTTDPDNGTTASSEAIALTDISATPNDVITFVDIGGGTTNITAIGGAAAGAVSQNIPATPEESIQFDQAGNRIDGNLTEDSAVVCFADGTRILTPNGFVAIDDLSIGDLICTKDSGAQPIRWISSRTISLCELLAEPKLYPIKLPAAGGAPLRVSRQHRLLVSGNIAHRMFGQNEVLVPAKDLVGHDDVMVDENITEVTYFHLLLDEHEIINANGVAAESLYLGAEGLKALSPAAREELAEILPQIADDASLIAGDVCRPGQSGHKAQKFAFRCEKNGKQLVASF